MAEIFQPVRGTQSRIDAMPIREGFVYFVTDTGKILLDKDGARYSLGGGSSSIIYAIGGDSTISKDAPDIDTDYNYTISFSALEDKKTTPLKDSLILNSDGRFFRVISADESTNTIKATLIAVSGTGTGGGGTGGGAVSVQDLALAIDEKTIGVGYTFIYGYNSNPVFTPSSTVDSRVNLAFQIIDETGNNPEVKIIERNLPSGQKYRLDTSKFPLSSNITLKITVSSNNSRMPDQQTTYRISDLSTVEMGIKKATIGYIPMVTAEDVSGKLNLDYVPVGNSKITSIKEILHVYIDGNEEPSLSQSIAPSSYGKTNTIAIPRQTHGAHTIELSVSADINGQTIESEAISYEAAWAIEGDNSPIVWIGPYDKKIINYENSYINFMVFDPEANAGGIPATIQIYKDQKLISEMSARYSASGWLTYDISAIYEVGDNTFAIACRSAKKEVNVFVTTEGSRDLGIDQADALIANFSSAGRSNLEVKSAIGIWSDAISKRQAVMTGFNWQNNGWSANGIENGIDNGTFLAITNGAKVTLPADSITLNSNFNYTIETRFRVRNVQKYSTLIQNVGMYFYENEDGSKSDKSMSLSEIQKKGLNVAKDEWGNMLMDNEHTEQIFQTKDGVICKWMNSDNFGLCIGSQEAYFRSPTGIVNVRYKEDEVINLSFVISVTEHLVYIYLNGILSGAKGLPTTASGNFTINTNFEFNSDYCDVDLYRFRIFKTGLTMPQVIHNYLSDIHSIKLYDQNQLTDALRPTALSYELLTKYNEEHPDEQSMPYCVWKVQNNGRAEKLPFFKGDKCQVEVSFVNPCLDRALETGEISEYYYYTHSPSFTAKNVDIDVQGTSSQGYPRRNYKTKYKNAKDTWVYTKGSLAGKPMTKDYEVLDGNGVSHKVGKKFHMDNVDLGTNKFTWKIDYMESSGSYNTGFANLMGNLQYPLYTKHPIEDLGIKGDGLRTSVYGYPVLVFHEYANPENNISDPKDKQAIYEYIGRYNMNLDKGSNEYYGFEVEEEQPYLEEREYTVKNAGGTEEVIRRKPYVSEIAECWELEDNQGTWCSFRYPSEEARKAGFGTSQDGYPDRLEVMRHFEYRYSPYEDQLDAIGPDGAYDGSTSDEKILAQIGTTDASKSAYARNTYKNLEVVFNWLDSTDQTTATGENLENPVVYTTSKDYTKADVANSIANKNEKGENSGTYQTTFFTDSAEYRLEKFRAEFTDHMDKEYCLIYFIMTELLLCYDSRGKNMMFASFGPHKLGGDYIWYPIFYDIDTQLGLNNSGAYLWDYDADVTQDGLFSTATSVLWSNFYDAFLEDIKNKYRALRGADDKTKVVNSLRYDTITGAYQCDPEIFDSYAMKGVRPTIAIGLDEYYKYFATTAASNIGYFNTKGELIKESEPSFAYACQGDKKLTIELLLRNRLNYIDSWWLGGSYHITQVKNGQLQLRVGGNDPANTSDKYLDKEALTADEVSKGFELATWPKPYFDARPGYKLKPFLKQYITYFTDEVPGTPVKYTGVDGQEDGAWTNVPASTMFAYKNGSFDQQLNYIPGLDYLSSLGDLSIAYPGEFRLSAGKRLLDLSLGSDVPGYKNGLITSGSNFELYNGEGDSGKKALLKKAVFTNLVNLDKNLDMSGSGKLQEFRALGTKVPLLKFANGAPLHTVHVPKSLTTLELVSNRELTSILTSAPVVVSEIDSNGNAVYADPSTYRGLYIENVTDYTSNMKDSGHQLSSLIIEDSGLGYDSYKVLENLIALKENAVENNTLKASFNDVEWTPYVVVENGEPYVKGVDYFKLTDHSTYEPYQYVDDKTFDTDTLNELVFTYDTTKDKNTITSLELFDKLIKDYEDNLNSPNGNRFNSASNDNTHAVLTITGDVFIANAGGPAINEAELTEKYKAKFPNLSITAENIKEANITKYVRVLDSGKVETIEILRTSGEHPLAPTALVPTKTDYDFLGWSTDETEDNLLIHYNVDTAQYVDMDTALNSYTFSDDNNNLVLYAIFTIHKHAVTFYNGAEVYQVLYIPHGSAYTEPAAPPYRSDAALALDQTYKFNGYSLNREDTTEVNQAPPKTITKPISLYATFYQDSVYNNVLDEKYFNYSYETLSFNDYATDIIKDQRIGTLQGKITLPTTYKGQPVTSFGPNSDEISFPYITHIFWQKENNNVKEYAANAFMLYGNRNDLDDKLVYVEIPNYDFSIGQYAFSNRHNFFNNVQITQEVLDEFFAKISHIGQQAFGAISESLGREKYFTRQYSLNLPGDLTYIGQMAFQANYIEKITLGSQSKPFDLNILEDKIFQSTGFGGMVLLPEFTPKVTLYTATEIDSEEVATKLFGVENQTKLSNIYITVV